MDKLIDFLKINFWVIFITLVHLFIFALLFFLFDLPWSIYQAGASVSLLILVGYLIYKWIFYKKQQALKYQLIELQKQLKEGRFESRKHEQELEDYFMLWVHQIKTPITASKLILENSNPDRTTQELSQELISIDRYTNLAINYLKVTRTDANIDYQWVDIDDMIAPLLRKYRQQFIQGNNKLHYLPIEQKVLTDANLTQVMIEQILSNSLKYTKDGEIWINYQDGYVTIKDNGIGISADNQPRVFERGFSGMNGRLNEKSSGIGLYMVQLISDRLNQYVSLDSKVGRGTSVSIFLHENPEIF